MRARGFEMEGLLEYDSSTLAKRRNHHDGPDKGETEAARKVRRANDGSDSGSDLKGDQAEEEENDDSRDGSWLEDN